MSNVEIIRGNNYPPVQWQFLVSTGPDVIFDLTGSVFKLSMAWGAPTTNIVLSSDVDEELTVDLETGILSWNYSTEDSRDLPVGQSARYEIERWIDGTQQTLVRGYFVVSEGLNPD